MTGGSLSRSDSTSEWADPIKKNGANVSRRPRKKSHNTGGTPAAGDRAIGGRASGTLRIIGGRFRGRKLIYHGDRRVRPMKDRIRESVFNLLGPAIAGYEALDLFAGTGALGLEALSRGAVRLTAIEQHRPTAKLVEENARLLNVAGDTRVMVADACIWCLTHLRESESPWVIFCSPPYALYRARQEGVTRLVQHVWQLAAPHSLLVVETDHHFHPTELLPAESWDVRVYEPAHIGIVEKGPPTS